MQRAVKGLISLVIATAVLAGCAAPTMPPPAAPPDPGVVSADRAARNFFEVVETLGPVATQVCYERARGRRCDFVLLIDERTNQPSNAYQTEDKSGRPVIVVTLPLIADARNKDELAFILGHEAAHHIAGHIARSETNAQIGALILGNIAAASGYSPQTVEAAASLGAEVGVRQFSKDYELEADALGAVIARRAGYDAVRGSAYFFRIPDPGDQFLGTHPPNAERMAVIRRAAAGG